MSRVTQRVSLVASVSGALVAATAVAVIVALVTSSGNAGSDVSAAGLAAPAHPVAAKAAPPVHRATAGSHQAGAQPSAAPQRSSASHPAQHAAPHAAAKPAASHRAKPAHLAARHQAVPNTWRAITEAAAGHPHGGALTPAQKLLPAGLSRGQAALPITPARAENAQLITAQALHLHMGIRSAVIAVATAMQESTLENLSYGDRDSLGLFQQRPSAGWGSPRQITDPTYAADAFLHALASYQHADPAWASQPLWEAAQGVQRSAYPTAYAQWEDQAAHIVAVAARHLM